jgi:3-oxocholest-4-en-26-oate---CoA ligase
MSSATSSAPTSTFSTEHNKAAVHEAIAASIPDKPCIIWRGRTWTWSEVTDRSRRLANYLMTRGIEIPVGREFLDNHESGQDHLGIYLYNGNEYLETMLGAYKARVAPFNVNYRYVAEELRYVLVDANCKILIYHSSFAPTLAEIRDQLPNLEILIQVADSSGNALLEGAVDYETVLAASSGERPEVQVLGGDWSADDLYILYTGGTTGMPKGVLWRQADIANAAMGLHPPAGQHQSWQSIDEIVAHASSGAAAMTILPSAPFMHGAGQWIAFRAWHGGGSVVIQDSVEKLDPVDLLRACERSGVQFLQIVGDAFGRPIVDEIERAEAEGKPYDLSKLAIVLSGGAALSAPLKNRLLAAVPHLMVIDGIGSSEAGGQMSQISAGAGGNASTGTFICSPENHVLSEDLGSVLDADHEGMGWLAKSGRLPLGYLGDDAKTKRTFPTVKGTRYSVPGDRARLLSGNDATFGLPIVELHGRDAVTINSGGEKIFAEEVEAALMAHPDVYDVTVAGRPSERWGNEVVAIVQLVPGTTPTIDSLNEVASKMVARYKLPKSYVFVETIVRSPSGKADYRWAKSMAAGEASSDQIHEA